MKNKNIKYAAVLAIGLSVIGCKNQTASGSHTHGEDSHTHDTAHEHAAVDYFGAYVLENETYGTKTTVTIKDGKRIIETNAIPNHKTGTFPNEGNPNTIKAQKSAYSLPLNPKYTGEAKWVREPGVALNGIKFEPETAEVVFCESGENYRVEAKQDLIDLGLDFNNAHVQPTGAYHYHGTPTSMISEFDTGEDLVHIGFAKDGFPIYYSKSNAYKPSFRLYDENREGEDCSYSNPHQQMDITVEETAPDGTFKSDWEYVAGLGDLDECNGINLDGKYMYLVTDVYPYVSRCLMGEFEEERHGPPPGGGREGGGPPPGGGPPRGKRSPRT